LFAARPQPLLATSPVLAPRRLEPRRLLDAAAPGVALEVIERSLDYVQTGPDAATMAESAEVDAQAAEASIVTPHGSLDILPSSAVDEGGVATLEFVYDVPGAHTVEIDWGDGNIEQFDVSENSQLFSTTHLYEDDDPTGTPFDDMQVKVSVISAAGTVADTSTIRVNNVAPSNVQVAASSPIDENGLTNLTVTFDDPGTLDSHTIEVNWGDGVIETFTLNGERFLFTTHQYLDDDPTGTPFDMYTINVRVVDDDGGEGTGAGQVRVNNVAPSNVQVAASSPINENGITNLTVTFDDPGTLDSHTIEVNWGDGVIETFTLNGERFLFTTHQYLDDDPTGTPFDMYTINVRVVDDDGGEGTGAGQVRVNNVAPSNVQVAASSPIDENGLTNLTVTFDDPGTLDSHTIEVNWGDGVVETFTLNGERFLFTSHQYLDDNPTATPFDDYTVLVRVIDDDGGVGEGSGIVRVNNVAPSNVQVSLTGPIDENGVTNLSMTFDDPGTLDTHTVEIDWGDGVVETFTLNGQQFLFTTHQYLDDNPSGTSFDVYTVNVRVIDDDTGVGTGSGTVRVNNVAPSNVQVNLTSPVDENGLTNLTVTFDDPGTLDAHTIEVTWGDGTTEIFTLNGERFLFTSHQYLDDDPSVTTQDPYTVNVRVIDDDGGEAMGSGVIIVRNVAPSNVQVNLTSPVNENGVTTLTTTFDDPGTLDSHTIEVTWGDGTVETFDLSGERFFSTTHQYLDDDPSVTTEDLYTVTVRVIDDDSGVGVGSGQVLVKNVAPVATAVTPPPAGVFEGSLASFTFTFADPGTLDTHTYEVNWGDGTSTVFGNIPVNDRTFTASHTYADNGNYTINVTLRDDDSGETTTPFVIAVANVSPTIAPTSEVKAIIEGQTVTYVNLGTFTDPGFDNPALGTVESFSATIDWGDGTAPETLTGLTWTTGSEGVPTIGNLGGASHTYLDNDLDGTPDFHYNPVITLYDDDSGEVVGVFTIEVRNSTPVLISIVATDVNTKGETTLTITFSDMGVDNHRIAVDWGDGLPDPPLELTSEMIPGTSESNPNLTAARSGVQTIVITHMYTAPPNPDNPTAPIRIFVQVWDDDVLVVDGTNVPRADQPVLETGFSNILDVTIKQPGIGPQDMFRIDTTPRVPLLTIIERPAASLVFGDARTNAVVLTSVEITGGAGESVVTGERRLELCVVNPDGTEQPGIPLAAKWLNNLSGLFRNLPDNRYAIYLVQAQTNARRKVIEVVVRNGRVIDPGDDSDGARDRPPTEEPAAGAAEGEGGAPPEQGAMPEDEALPPASDQGSWSLPVAPAPPSSASLRHGRAIAGAALCLSAAGRPWLQQIEKALAQAKPSQWRRLRTAGHWKRRPR